MSDAVERALEALEELLRLITEDEKFPSHHDDDCQAWCHYREPIEKARSAAAGLRAEKRERVWFCRNYGEYYGEPCGCGHEDELGCGWRLLVGGK